MGGVLTGVVSLLSMDESLPDENVLAIVTAYGDVKMSDVKFIEKHPSIRNCRLVTFYDVRHAEAAYQKINANPPRVPTISEVGEVTRASVLSVLKLSLSIGGYLYSAV